MIKTLYQGWFHNQGRTPVICNKDWTDPVNAKDSIAAELIKHNYRQGWNLPDMPR